MRGSPALSFLLLLAVAIVIKADIKYSFIGFNSKPESLITVNNTILVNGKIAFDTVSNFQSDFNDNVATCDSDLIYTDTQVICQSKDDNSYSFLNFTNTSNVVSFETYKKVSYPNQWDPANAQFSNNTFYHLTDADSDGNRNLTMFNLTSGNFSELDNLTCQGSTVDPANSTFAFSPNAILYTAQTSNDTDTAIFYCYYDLAEKKIVELGTTANKTTDVQSRFTSTLGFVNGNTAVAAFNLVTAPDNSKLEELVTFSWQNVSSIKSGITQGTASSQAAAFLVDDKTIAGIFADGNKEFLGFFNINETSGLPITISTLQLNALGDYGFQLLSTSTLVVFLDDLYFTINLTTQKYERVDSYAGSYIMAPLWYPKNNTYVAVAPNGLFKHDIAANTITNLFSQSIFTAYYDPIQNNVYFLQQDAKQCGMLVYSLDSQKTVLHTYPFGCDNTNINLVSASFVDNNTNPSFTYEADEDIFVYNSKTGQQPDNKVADLPDGQPPLFIDYNNDTITYINSNDDFPHYQFINMTTGETTTGKNSSVRGDVAKVDDQTLIYDGSSGFKVENITGSNIATGSSRKSDVDAIMTLGSQKGTPVQYYFFDALGNTTKRMFGSIKKQSDTELPPLANVYNPLSTNNTLVSNNKTSVIFAGVYANTTLLGGSSTILSSLGMVALMLFALIFA